MQTARAVRERRRQGERPAAAGTKGSGMSTARNLFDKVWDAHTVRELEGGQTQLLIGTHLIHEVTSPQAFGMLRDLNLPVRMPERTFATRSEEHTSELQSRGHLVCRLLLEQK